MRLRAFGLTGKGSDTFFWPGLGRTLNRDWLEKESDPFQTGYSARHIDLTHYVEMARKSCNHSHLGVIQLPDKCVRCTHP